MEHTFVICAYKESPYLEECICSLKSQTMQSDIVLATSTPSGYLKDLCGKYQIHYCVRDGKPGIAPDWNYALSVAKTPYVTIAHQDDIYESGYADKIMSAVTRFCKRKGNEQPLILFTDYTELLDGEKYRNRINLRIKRFLLYPIKKQSRQNKRFWKRHILRFGNAVCCPSVTYHKSYIDKLLTEEKKDELFEKHFRSNLDWEAWEWLSRKRGTFVYIPECLMSHRIHGGSETTAAIHDRQRRTEDYEMFSRFWAKWIAGLITGIYSESEKSNEV